MLNSVLGTPRQAGGSGGSWNGGAVTNQTIFNAEVDVNKAFVLGVQSFVLNGAAQTIDGTLGSAIEVSGSTGASTIKLPASPIVGQRFVVSNSASVAWTLDGNGNNVDGAATVTIAAGIGRTLEYTTTNKWRTSNFTKAQADALYAALAVANTLTAQNTFSGRVDFNGLVTIKVQTFANTTGAIGTIDPTAGTAIEVTGSNASTTGTLNLNASPVTGTEIWVTNKSTAQISVAGNGQNISGSSTYKIEAGDAALFHANGTEWTIQDTGIAITAFDFLSPLAASPIMWMTGVASTWANGASVGCFQQIKVSRRTTPTKLVWICTTQSGNYDVGIYNSAGTKIWSKGGTACPAAGVITETVSGVIMDKGQTYWVGFSFDNTSAALRCWTTISTSGGAPTDSQGNPLCTQVASQYPMQSTVTIGTTPPSRVPSIFLREA